MSHCVSSASTPPAPCHAIAYVIEEKQDERSRVNVKWKSGTACHRTVGKICLPPGSRQEIAKLVKVDIHLFSQALAVFEQRLRSAQAQTGVAVVCEQRLRAVWRAAQDLTSRGR